MSKLFDQLKKAAGSREQKSPGLLLDALQTAHNKVDPDRGGAIVAPPQATVVAPAQAAGVAPAKAGAQSTYAGIALAILIFAVAVLAWHAAPWQAPPKVKIDPSGLKLDRSLDLKRPSSEGTSPPRRPS